MHLASADHTVRLSQACRNAAYHYEIDEDARFTAALSELEGAAWVGKGHTADHEFVTLDAMRGHAAFAAGDWDAAEKGYQSAIERASRLLSRARGPWTHPERRQDCDMYNNALALLHVALGEALSARNPDSAAAEAAYRRAVEHARFEPKVCLAYTYESFARLHMRRKSWQEAEMAFRAAATGMSDRERGSRSACNHAHLETERARVWRDERQSGYAMDALRRAAQRLIAEVKRIDEKILGVRGAASPVPAGGTMTTTAESRHDRERKFYEDEKATLLSWLGMVQLELANLHREQDHGDEASAAFADSAKNYRTAGDSASACVVTEFHGDMLAQAGRLSEAGQAYARARSENDSERFARGTARLLAKRGAVSLLLGECEEGHVILDECRALVRGNDEWSEYGEMTRDALSVSDAARLGAALRAYYDSLVRANLPHSERRAVIGGLRALFSRTAGGAAARDPKAFSVDDKPLLNVVTPLIIEIDGPTLDRLGGPSKLVDVFAPAMRERLKQETGVSVPGIRFRANDHDLPSGRYILSIHEIVRAEGTVDEQLWFAPVRPEALAAAEIQPVRVDLSSKLLQGCWLQPGDSMRATQAGLAVWDPLEHLVRHMERLVAANLVEIVGHQEVQNLMELHKVLLPGQYASIVSKEAHQHMDALTNVVRCLVAERVPVNEFTAVYAIFERMWREEAPAGAIVDAIRLLEQVQPRLWGNEPERQPYWISESFEAALEAYRHGPDGRVLAIPPEVVQSMLAAIQNVISDTPSPVLIARRQIHRALLRRIVEFELPDLPVLAGRETEPGLLRRARHEIRLEGGARGHGDRPG